MNLAQRLADARFWERDDRPEESLNPYREVAGLCWTAPSVADREMDPALADVFARALRAAIFAENEGCAKEIETTRFLGLSVTIRKTLAAAIRARVKP